MPWSAGIYTRGYPSWSADAAANLPISSTKFDTEDNDFATGLNNCLTKDGLSIPIAAMTWGLPSSQVLALTRGSDGAVFGIGRTGGSNNPVLTLSVADSTGVTLNQSNGSLSITGTSGLIIGTATGGAQGAGTVNAQGVFVNGTTVLFAGTASPSLTGNWVFNPASGTGLQVNGANNAPIVVFNSTTTSWDYTQWQSSGVDIGNIGNGAAFGTTASDFVVAPFSGNLRLFSAANGTALAVGTAGNITISAPSSGVALQLNAASGSRGATFTGVSGFNVLDLIQVAGQGAVLGLNGNGAAQNWDVGGALSATHFQVYDVTGGLLCMDITPATGLMTAVDQGGTQQTVGWRDVPQNAQSGNYGLVLADRGKSVTYIGGGGNTFTIPANASVAFPVGSAITIPNNGSGNLTIAITTDTLKWAPAGTTGSRTLAANGLATIIKVASTTWMVSGVGLS